MKRYEVDGAIFTSLTEALNFCLEEGISEANISEYDEDIETYCKEHPEDPECKRHRKEVHEDEEKTGIEDSPEEHPDESGPVIEERSLIAQASLKTLLEGFDEWDEDTKLAIIQQGLDLTNQSREKPARLKEMPEYIHTKDYVRRKYQAIVENLADLDTTVCPICNRPFEEGLTTEELDFWKPDLHPSPERPPKFTAQSKKHDVKLPKVLESPFPKIRLYHIKTKHPAIYKFLKMLFEVHKEMPNIAEDYTPNPESCNLEELSKEELTEEICGSEELRRQLFRKWKKSKERKA